MKKKMICGLLCLGLCLPSVFAAEGGFSDVKDSDWFAPYVAVCAESGLMNGTGNGNFSPGGTMTVAECAAIAARLRESATGEPIPGITPLPGETLPWYQRYVGYLTSNGVTVPEPTKTATRQEFFDLLSAVTSPEQLPAINSITALPDTDDEHVLAFYNAGILTGTDSYGTFSPDRTLQRSEVAAMVARLAKQELRLSFVPQDPAPAGASPSGQTSQQTDWSQAAMTVNSTPVPLDDVAYWVPWVAYQQDYTLATTYGVRLDLSQAEMAQAIRSQAEIQAAAMVILDNMAVQQGCEVSDLPAVLTPSPSREELNSYAAANDLLCAKHILVADEQTAQAVLDGLESVPTLEQFNALLYVFGTDPGMESNSSGYLFTAGQMVPEFENGVRALEIGSYTTEPVQSTYGYHIIWRLDPADHPDMLSSYQSDSLDSQVNALLQTAEIVRNQELLDQLDVEALYSSYLASLAAQQ